tara:strand:- start:1654 stop:2040 length:387 start_codon:yes stop_codon:yes gene_type:complete
MKISSIHPDNLGATFSSLCVIHCFATPFLFITQSYLLVVPGWWQALNYLFLSISFFAVYKTSKNSSSQMVKTLLYLFWSILAMLLISEEFELFHLPEFITYITGLSLAGLHIYNKRYCQCADDECCVD